MADSTVRRSARVPARCPSETGRPRSSAQRPFPSMMIATERASPTSLAAPSTIPPIVATTRTGPHGSMLGLLAPPIRAGQGADLLQDARDVPGGSVLDDLAV